MRLRFQLKYVLLFGFLLSLMSIDAQSKKQQELEEQRQIIQQQISQINRLKSQSKKEQKSVIAAVEDLDYKVTVLQNLIRITNQQANLLTREINHNQKQITSLRDKLKVLKEQYAAMIVKSYKSKSEQSKVMFLLSSSNFQQAYKRLEYIKQFAKHQKKQAEEIKLQTAKLQELNISLSKQKEDKQKLIEDNRASKNELQKEQAEKETLMASIKKDLNTYTAQIKTKQQEVRNIDKEIKRIIAAEIAKSNKKAGKSSSSKTFALTPEGKALAKNFVSNKGKLGWPVERGVVKVRFGNNQPHPLDKNLTFNSSGVRIATEKDAKVRSVFQGEVMAISTTKYGNNSIMIRHGNYISVYKNLARIYVQKGDKITSKQEIGEVLTNKSTGQSILRFSIFKDNEPQNPAHWIYKM